MGTIGPGDQSRTGASTGKEDGEVMSRVNAMGGEVTYWFYVCLGPNILPDR